jgi:hypothetical protein
LSLSKSLWLAHGRPLAVVGPTLGSERRCSVLLLVTQVMMARKNWRVIIREIQGEQAAVGTKHYRGESVIKARVCKCKHKQHMSGNTGSDMLVMWIEAALSA